MSTKLRYNEYYGMQETLDYLYDRSKKQATKGIDLYSIITSDNNIGLAFRNIKANKGSYTQGVDKQVITNLSTKTNEELSTMIREKLKNYKPSKVRRVNIPKENGGVRPLGIPTITDRIIQQMFKQVLEPICEAKFYSHSYGFRPNRSTRHAIARCQYLTNRIGLGYVVDIDIKSFFDTVNHRKLITQLYNIGITDKRVLTIINKMLKAEVIGEGVQNKGTPQGGILSPLLSNVVLHDLDMWIYTQWQGFPTEIKYRQDYKMIRLKKSKLKEMYIVRYADDFKVFTRDYKTAVKTYHAVNSYLSKHLQLDISKEKSRVTDLSKQSTDFLGFKMKLVDKGKKKILHTYITDENKIRIKNKIRKLVREIKRTNTIENVRKYNQYIMSIKDYYKYATMVSQDLIKLSYEMSKTTYNQLKDVGKYGRPIYKTELYKKYHKNNFKTFNILETPLHHLADVRTINNMNFSQKICDYTTEGRDLVHKHIKQNVGIEIIKMMNNPVSKETIEYNDNRLSKYSAQQGICNILGTFLNSFEAHCHHIKPKRLGGKDEYRNLVIVHEDVHRLLHSTRYETIQNYLRKLNLTEKQLDKVNKLRKKCEVQEIKLD